MDVEESAMLCPVCRVEMFTLEFEKVEIDYCPECGGVWLDSGEVEIIGERAGALHKELLLALDGSDGGGAGKRLCPVCNAALLRVRAPGGTGFDVDRCPRRHGLWFDQGELEAVILAAGAGEQNVLAAFLADLEKQRKKDGRVGKQEIGR
jgi:uncharacterized protein